VANNDEMANNKYDSLLSVSPIKNGAEVKLTVSQIPQGRKPYWIAGSVFAGIIFLFSFLMTIKTKVKIKEEMIA
jgi:hypothetical protein